MRRLASYACDGGGWEAAGRDLREHGYAAIRSAAEPELVRRCLEAVRLWHERTEGLATRDLPAMGGGAVVWNLQNKDPVFLEMLFARAELEQLLMRFLNDPWYRAIPEDRPNYVLRAFIARAGLGSLPLHIDSFIPYAGEHAISLQCVFVLEPMSVGAGASLVVPGSHQNAAWATQSALEDAVAVEAEPGDLLLWDSRLWHGARDNPSGVSRWALIATFTRWWIKQAFQVTEALPDSIYASLSDSQRAVLGFCSQPWLDESEGIRAQHGYDVLAQGRPRPGRR